MHEVTLQAPYIDENELVKRTPKLFHYTRLSALQAILTSGVLWATHYRWLNDLTEFSLAQDTVAEAIHGRCKEELERFVRKRPVLANRMRKEPGGIEAVIKQDTQVLPKAITTIADRMTPMHVTSFSAHEEPHQTLGGILTLWRAYGGNAGVALRFDTQRLLDSLVNLKKHQLFHALYLSRVTYGDCDPRFVAKLDGLAGLAEIYVKVAKGLINKTTLEDVLASSHEETAKYMVTSITHKHIAFEDEREIRLVAAPITESKSGVGIASISRVHIPCLGALEDVMVGPSSNQATLRSEVLDLISRHGRSDVTVSLSDIPYRN